MIRFRKQILLMGASTAFVVLASGCTSAAASKNQQAIEAINEKIDRMFKRSVSK